MPNAVIGFDDAGQMWMDQGVDVRASDASATRGPRRLGRDVRGLGNLILATAEEAESRFPVLNLGRELTTDTGGAGRWRGQPGTRNVKQVLEPVHRDGLDGVAAPSAARPAAAATTRRPTRIASWSARRRSTRSRAPSRRSSRPARSPPTSTAAAPASSARSLRDPEAVREDVLDEYVSVERRARALRRRAARLASRRARLAVDAEATRRCASGSRPSAGGRRDELARRRSTSAGTFTDFALQKGDALVLEKTLSTPADRSLAVMDGPREARGARGPRARRLPRAPRRDRARHDGRRQHADREERRRHGPPHDGGLPRRARAAARLQGGHLGRAAPAAARRSCRAGAGSACPSASASTARVTTPLDEEAARAAIARLARQGVESLAICAALLVREPGARAAPRASSPRRSCRACRSRSPTR